MELELIKNSILEIRGKKVMLDMDLAKIYDVETRAGFYVSIDKRRMVKLDITICDIKLGRT